MSLVHLFYSDPPGTPLPGHRLVTHILSAVQHLCIPTFRRPATNSGVIKLPLTDLQLETPKYEGFLPPPVSCAPQGYLLSTLVRKKPR